MSGQLWTESEDADVIRLKVAGNGWNEIAARLGKTPEGCRKRFKRMEHNEALAAVAPKPEVKEREEQVETTDSGDSKSLVYHGKQIRTVTELLEHCEVDLKLWEVAESTINSWEVAGKFKAESRLWKTGLLQIKVKLRRLAPKPIQDGIKLLLKDVRPIATTAPRKIGKGDKQLLEIGLFDHHFGKRAWAQEVGMNYDLKIAEREFEAAISEMLSRVANYPIERILFPLGNDFFHVNDWMGNTANLTRVSDSSTDDRFALVFRTGCRAVQAAIEACLKIAPVHVMYVPGNHDRHTSWFITEWCAAVFRNNKHVTVDSTPGNRKYVEYGPALLGYMHGDEIKHADLPTLMAQERPQMWSRTTFRSWRLGHWHKRKETRYVAGDTFQGVEVKIFPSLCGTDSWHYSHGFIGNARMAECYLWDSKHGPAGNFVVHAKEPIVRREVA